MQSVIDWKKNLLFGIHLNETRPLTIIIEGNIGCGKTTFTKRFLADRQVCTLLEPLEEYRDVAGINLLDLMYQDPDRYCYRFQHHAQMVMFDRHLQTTSLPVKVMERSIFSGNCFIEARRRLGNFRDFESHLLRKNFDLLIRSSELRVDLIVYLRVSPETSFARVSSRSREEESNISLELLRTIHEVHEDWLIKQTFSSLPAPVLVINAESTADQVYSNFCVAMSLGYN